MLKKRRCGLLLHLTSLPSPFGIGDIGPWAYQFVDFLAKCKQTLWQILPLNPTDPIHNNSPYNSISAFACNRLLISPELLIQDDLLLKSDLESAPLFPKDKVDFRAVHHYKNILLERAYGRFKRKNQHPDYERFCAEQSSWLDDFALFMALKLEFSGQVWSDWPQALRDRRTEDLHAAQRKLSRRVDREKFVQYLFFRQWNSLKNYCHEQGVQIIGDIPIYVDHDSADVWVHPELFKLDESKKPYVVAGVPPDYFSKTGQRWGNPIYRWDILKEEGYPWWTQRIAHNLTLFDFVRIDHFRGLVAYWEIPATEETAVNGNWIEAPALDFFNHLLKEFPGLPLIAEDLGIITPDVRETMDHFHFPGMKVLLFAFGHDLPTNPYIPHNFPRDCVAYTGTHDNNTAKGWLETEASPDEQKGLFRYLGRNVPLDELPQELIRLVMMSVANAAIFPVQDILGLGAESRMNLPSTREGNWEWRLSPDLLTPQVAERLREMTEIYGRS
jgi:4-alpha-glucanotransferase